MKKTNKQKKTKKQQQIIRFQGSIIFCSPLKAMCSHEPFINDCLQSTVIFDICTLSSFRIICFYPCKQSSLHLILELFIVSSLLECNYTQYFQFQSFIHLHCFQLYFVTSLVHKFQF